MNFDKTVTHSDGTLFKMFVRLSTSVLMVHLGLFFIIGQSWQRIRVLRHKKEKVILSLATIYLLLVCITVSVRKKLTHGAFMRWCNNTFTCWCLKCLQGNISKVDAKFCSITSKNFWIGLTGVTSLPKVYAKVGQPWKYPVCECLPTHKWYFRKVIAGIYHRTESCKWNLTISDNIDKFPCKFFTSCCMWWQDVQTVLLSRIWDAAWRLLVQAVSIEHLHVTKEMVTLD